jgi:hypothetical protein
MPPAVAAAMIVEAGPPRVTPTLGDAGFLLLANA